MKKYIVVLLVVGLLVNLAPVLAAAGDDQVGEHQVGQHDQAGEHNQVGQHDDGVPEGSVLVLDITHKVINDEDSGIVGYWALDNYNKHVKVWKLPDGKFYVKAKYEGKWQTFAGAKSPGAGVVQSKNASGEFEGGYTATFNATSVTPAFGNIGTKDYNGTKADVLLGTYGAGQTGPTTPFSYLSTYFSGTSNFTYIHWGWTYEYKHQRWINSDVVTKGDIVV